MVRSFSFRASRLAVCVLAGLSLPSDARPESGPAGEGAFRITLESLADRHPGRTGPDAECIATLRVENGSGKVMRLLHTRIRIDKALGKSFEVDSESRTLRIGDIGPGEGGRVYLTFGAACDQLQGRGRLSSMRHCRVCKCWMDDRTQRGCADALSFVDARPEIPELPLWGPMDDQFMATPEELTRVVGPLTPAAEPAPASPLDPSQIDEPLTADTYLQDAGRLRTWFFFERGTRYLMETVSRVEGRTGDDLFDACVALVAQTEEKLGEPQQTQETERETLRWRNPVDDVEASIAFDADGDPTSCVLRRSLLLEN